MKGIERLYSPPEISAFGRRTGLDDGRNAKQFRHDAVHSWRITSRARALRG